MIKQFQNDLLYPVKDMEWKYPPMSVTVSPIYVEGTSRKKKQKKEGQLLTRFSCGFSYTYISYIGMCRPKRYGFQAVWFWKR